MLGPWFRHHPDRTGRSRHPRPAALAGILLVVAACASPTNPSVAPSAPSVTTSPTPSGSPIPSADANAIYDTIEQQVVEIRELQPTREVPRRFITKEELQALITADFDEQTPADYLVANERLYKALGLIPADASLRQLTLDLLGNGVVGFYRNDEGTLYVRSQSGAPGPNERFTFSHEFDHALQDQNFTVFKDQHGVLDQSDRLFARQAVYEGDATLVMTKWAAAHLTQSELVEVANAGSDPAALAVLSRTPAILREGLLFPYTTGFGFVQARQGPGGWKAVDALYARMPASTEQILHPEKYAADEAPVAVTLPADLPTRLGKGWTAPLKDTFGEFQMATWLRESGVVRATADAAAAGWGGDRLTILEGPGGAWALAWKTAWDTPADAAQFESAATTAIAKAGGPASVLPGEGGKVRWVVIASDPSTLGRVNGVLGLAG